MTPPTIPDHPDAGTALFYDPLTRKNPTPMARKVEVHLEDDFDGDPADTTLTFALDGKDFEIDLSEANAEKLREALRPFVPAARKAPPARGAASAPPAPPSLQGRPPPSAPGPRTTATPSPTAAASTSPSRTPTTPPTN